MTLGFQEESLFLFSLEQLPTFINTINSWIIEFNAHNYYTKKILINLVYQWERKGGGEQLSKGMEALYAVLFT